MAWRKVKPLCLRYVCSRVTRNGSVLRCWHGVKTDGGEWNADLLFKIPVSHPEIERLQGRYQKSVRHLCRETVCERNLSCVFLSQGGLEKGKVVELMNKQLALVVDVNATHVTLDANNMMAGKRLVFEVSLDGILPTRPKKEDTL